MTQVDFYQLAGTPVTRVLASIAGNVLKAGGRLLAVAGDEEQAATLDDALWALSPDSFLPHGRADADDAGADQPVLIAIEPVAANGARHVALADGCWRAEAMAFDRAFLLFYETATPAARDVWRSLGDEVTRNYWAQDGAGRWARRG